jgi:hypothetical protein
MMMMSLALLTFTILSLIVLLLNIYAELRSACVGLGIVILGMSGIKPEGEGVLGTLAGVSSNQPIWDRG